MSDVAAEYRALRTHAAVYALGDRTLVRATGPDRIAFLQGMLTNDVAGLRPGEGCAALLLTIQGRVVADLRVAVTDDVLLLDVDRGACAGFVALGRLIIADDVELVPDDEVAFVGVTGPAVTRLLPVVASLPPFAHAPASIDGTAVRVVRDAVGDDGAIVHVRRRGDAGARRAGGQWVRSCAAGGARGATHRMRHPRLGLDMGEKTLALEVRSRPRSARPRVLSRQEVIDRAGTARGT
jgi:folate-binding Fe-S cluster repair protein YgfZ